MAKTVKVTVSMPVEDVERLKTFDTPVLAAFDELALAI
jgi:hypothetical protein